MLSDKQKALVAFSKTDEFMCLSAGTVRSGKTYSTVFAFILGTQALKEPFLHIIGGRALRVMKQELLPLAQSIARNLGIACMFNGAENVLRIGRQKYLFVAGNDVRSEERARGLTCHSAFVDEATLVPESFWDMIVSRLSYEDSKHYSTCNPSFPGHYLKRKWIDESKVDRHFEFSFEDNPSLSQAVVARYRSMFSGVFAKRMVSGLWALAEGLIYPDYKYWTPTLKPMKTCVGLDYGIASPTAFVALSKYRLDKKIFWCLSAEKYIDGGTDKLNLTDDQVASELIKFCALTNAKTVVLDPSAASLRNTLIKHKKRKFTVRNGKNDVLPGIRTMGNALASGKVLVNPALRKLEEEMQDYSWDPDKDDEPIKEDDHLCDAARYVIFDEIPKVQHAVKLPEGF